MSMRFPKIHEIRRGISDRTELWRFTKFILIGIINTAFGYGVFVTVDLVTGSWGGAVIAMNILGVAFNYITTGRLVFAHRGVKALAPFALGYGAVLVLNLVILQTLTRLGVSALRAQAITIPWLVAFSYMINRLIVFRPRHES
jgi:putative flippase GtrA